MTIRALGTVAMPIDGPDRHKRRLLMAADLDTISAEQLATLARLTWRYRRQLPSHMAPKLNPDDPIVRSLASTP